VNSSCFLARVLYRSARRDRCRRFLPHIETRCSGSTAPLNESTVAQRGLSYAQCVPGHVCVPGHCFRGHGKLNDADAVIFDLRDNRGGFPSMVSLIAAYLFDHPEYLYCPLEKHNSRIVDALAGSRQQTR